MANQETVSPALSTMATEQNATHLPHGTDLDLDSRTQPWSGAHPEGGYFETGQPLKPEKVPSRQGGGVPARTFLTRQELKALDPDCEITTFEPAKDFGLSGYVEQRNEAGELIAFGTAQNWTVLDPEAFVTMQRAEEAQKNPEAVESDSVLDFGRGVADVRTRSAEDFRSMYLGPGLPPLMVPVELADAVNEIPAWGAIQPLRETTIHRMARAVLEREEETLP